MGQRIGQDIAWLRGELRKGATNPRATHEKLTLMNGGYQWMCPADASEWIRRADVRKALHLDGIGKRSGFHYDSTGPASITLYPELMKKLRMILFNGDADACVPYNGYEDLLGILQDNKVLEQSVAWTPWYTRNRRTAAGYRTKYTVNGSDKDVTFMTIRLAGHMVPQFQPEAAFVMLQSFIQGGSQVSSLTVV